MTTDITAFNLCCRFVNTLIPKERKSRRVRNLYRQYKEYIIATPEYITMINNNFSEEPVERYQLDLILSFHEFKSFMKMVNKIVGN